MEYIIILFYCVLSLILPDRLGFLGTNYEQEIYLAEQIEGENQLVLADDEANLIDEILPVNEQLMYHHDVMLLHNEDNFATAYGA